MHNVPSTIPECKVTWVEYVGIQTIAFHVAFRLEEVRFRVIVLVIEAFPDLAVPSQLSPDDKGKMTQNLPSICEDQRASREIEALIFIVLHQTMRERWGSRRKFLGSITNKLGSYQAVRQVSI